MTICKLSQSCEETFELINAAQGNRPTLEHSSGDVDREHGRFRVWARNIGALQEPTSASSLDSRLQAAPKVRNGIIDNLKGLLQSLDMILNIEKGDLPNRSEPIVVTATSAPVGTTTELNELVLDVRSSITDLFRYSMFLRRQRPRGREAPTWANFQAPDASLDIRHALDMFPKLKDHPWLAERIGKAIAQRREYIQFRQRHQLKSQPISERPSHTLETDTASTKATTYRENGESGVLPRESQSYSGRSTRTNATSFFTVSNGDGTDELDIFDLERLIFKNIPLCYNEHVECPLCRTIQRFQSKSDWRRHVFDDLQPYVCTFENCTVGLFKTRHEWFLHEMSLHRREWRCPKCYIAVDSQTKLRHHFEMGHMKDISKAQVEKLLNICDRPIRNFASGSCLLCDLWHPTSNSDPNSREFCKHLARHLQQLALSAIPLRIEGLEIKEQKEEAGEVETEESLRAQMMHYESTLGLNDPKTLTSMEELAAKLRQKGQLESTKILQMRLIEAYKSAYGPNSPHTILCMARLVSTFHHLGRFEEAEALQIKVVEAANSELGATHPDTIEYMAKLALVFRYLGRFEEAGALQIKVVEAANSEFGANHPDTIGHMTALALTFLRQGRLEEAESLQMQVMEAYQSTLGRKDLKTVNSMGHLAEIWHQMGRTLEATKLLEESLSLQMEVLGPDHLDTISSISTLNEWKERDSQAKDI